MRLHQRDIRRRASTRGEHGTSRTTSVFSRDMCFALADDRRLQQQYVFGRSGFQLLALAEDISSWATRENWYEPRLQSFKKSYDVQWPSWIPELDGPERFLNLTRVLLKRGWQRTNLARVLGGNWLRLLRETID